MKVELVQATPNAVEFIAKTASICYDSDPKNPLALVKHLYLNGHHSPFEHIYFTFKIEGISRACSHQLVRHRMCSFTQRSQRYCGEGDFEVVVPNSIYASIGLYEFNRALTEIKSGYNEMLADLIPKEDARYILPNACCTDLYLSCNLRELIHISNERLCKRAQWEIRELVERMVDLVDPELHFMLVPKCKSGRIICISPCNKK